MPVRKNDPIIWKVYQGSTHYLSVRRNAECTGSSTNTAKGTKPGGEKIQWEHTEITEGPKELALSQIGTYKVLVTATFTSGAAVNDCVDVISQVKSSVTGATDSADTRTLVNDNTSADAVQITIVVVARP